MQGEMFGAPCGILSINDIEPLRADDADIFFAPHDAVGGDKRKPYKKRNDKKINYYFFHILFPPYRALSRSHIGSTGFWSPRRTYASHAWGSGTSKRTVSFVAGWTNSIERA